MLGPIIVVESAACQYLIVGRVREIIRGGGGSGKYLYGNDYNSMYPSQFVPTCMDYTYMTDTKSLYPSNLSKIPPPPQ